MTDYDDIRTLARADLWLEAALVRMEARDCRIPRCTIRRLFAWLGRGLARHPVDRWVDTCLGNRSVSRRGRANFKRAWHAGDRVVRRTVRAWIALPVGAGPRGVALERIRAAYRARDEVSRELTSLRAIQSLSVLEVRNYRRLVFDLGGYAEDGESREVAEALP